MVAAILKFSKILLLFMTSQEGGMKRVETDENTISWQQGIIEL